MFVFGSEFRRLFPHPRSRILDLLLLQHNGHVGFPSHGVILYCSVYNVHKVVQARKGSMLLALAMVNPFLLDSISLTS